MSKNYAINLRFHKLKKKIEEVMDDELVVAKGKWKVFLTDEDEKRVLEYSRNQLRAKVHTITKDTNWDFNSSLKIFPVRKDGSPRLEDDIFLPKDASKEINILEVNDGWKLDDDTSIETISLQDFEEEVLSRILEWARTAVFYGVGSYKEVR